MQAVNGSLDIFIKLWRKYFDILRQSHHKAANTNIVADHRVEQPMAVINLLDIARSEWVFLNKKVVRHHSQFHLDTLLLKSRNAEDVDISLVVQLIKLPIGIQHLDCLNAGGIEEFVESRLWLVAPHLHIIRSEAEWLNQAVSNYSSV